MVVESPLDFVNKLKRDVGANIEAANRNVETDPDVVFVKDPLSEVGAKNLGELSRVKPEISEQKKQEPEAPRIKARPPELDEKKDREVVEDGKAALRDLAFTGFLSHMTSKLTGNNQSYVRKVETDFEGRENMALLEVYDDETKEREPDAVFKIENRHGALGRFNDSASGMIAKALNLRTVNERTWIPPENLKRKVA